MVEVFKTNVEDRSAANQITADLYKILPSSRINFDLEDCDKILRVETEELVPEEVAGVLICRGYMCEVLE
jgi:hypothetical protein